MAQKQLSHGHQKTDWFPEQPFVAEEQQQHISRGRESERASEENTWTDERCVS